MFPGPFPYTEKPSALPFWRTELHELDEHRSTPDLPSTCDILIIGGRYSGITVAYHLLCEENSNTDTKPTVVLCEAREACSGAIARNDIMPYIKKFGVKAAVEVADFEFNHVSTIAELVKKEKIDCDFVLTRSSDCTNDPEEAAALKAAYLKLKEAGIAKSTIDDLEWTDADKAEEVSRVRGCVGCFTFTAATLWPYKLMMHLLSLATTSGLKLQTHTLITTISHSLSSPRKWTATTPRGTITATKIIFATNGYVSGLLPEYTSKIVPTRGTAFRIITPPNSKHPEIKYSYSLRLPNGAGEYLHARPDGSIIGGGACAHFFPNPKSWYNVVDDSSLTDAPATYVFDNYMQEHFIGWEDSSVKVDGIWTGIMGYTSDVLPSVGEVPGRKGCYVAAGFDEHGMPVIYLTMKGIAEIVLKDRVLEEVGIPRIYKTTRERLESEDDLLKPKDWEEVKP